MESVRARGIATTLLAFLAGLGVAAVRAEDPDVDPLPARVPVEQTEPWCRNGAFPGELTEHRAMRVSPATREVVLRRDYGSDCPGQGDSVDSTCDAGIRLHAGDPVIAGRTLGGLTCVWFEGPQHEHVGYVPTAALSMEDEDDWLGTWADGEQRLSIRRDASGALQVQGDALWLGGVLDSGDRVVHVGGIEAEARFSGVRLIADDGWCRLAIRRVGGALVVHDNRQCGGMNVSFNGVYWPSSGT